MNNNENNFSKMQFPEERQAAIYKKILKEGSAKVNDLAKLFSVSDMTIRRDLEELEKRNMVTRSYGGATLKQESLKDYNFEKRLVQNLVQKQIIAKEAIKLIGSNELIALDASTSCLELVKKLDNNPTLKIVTNGLMTLNYLAELSMDVIYCGGTLRKEALSTIGPIAEKNISGFNFTKAFVSANAIHSSKGLMDTNIYEIAMKRLMVDQAKEVIVLADSSKIQKFAFHTVCPLDKINILITDHNVDDKVINIFEQQGVKTIIAKEE